MLVWYDDGMITIGGTISGSKIELSLFNGDKRIGGITGAGFGGYSSEIELWEDADKLGIDSGILKSASQNGLLARDVLVLDTMEIEPAYRGLGHGITLIKQAIQEFFDKVSKDFVVLMHPCPIGWPTRDEREVGMKALSSYYAKHLPIKRISKSPYFYFTVDNQSTL